MVVVAVVVATLGVAGGAWLYANQRAMRRAAVELASHLETERARRGRPVILLGYPAGLELLLARVDPALLATLVDPDVVEITDRTVDIPVLLEKLSRAKQIHPYPTSGRLTEKRPHQLAHDAGTASGGSGGPIFATSGRVIGMNSAIAREFEPAALGLPIREAIEPLAQVRRIPAR
jgi:serine protease Do